VLNGTAHYERRIIMSQAVRGHGFFQGAHISLGPVNITGKSYDEYQESEIAFIVGRYMVHNSDDGKTYQGSVARIVTKLWPDRFPTTAEFTDTRDAKKIYFWLKQFGFTNRRGEHPVWFLPADLDNAYGQRVLLRGTRGQHDVPVAPVVIRCVCGAGPFDSQKVFYQHREIHEKEVPSLETKKEPTSSEPEMVSCPTCGAKVSGLKAHLFGAHKQSQCKKCGKVMHYAGLGGHAQSHRMPKSQRLLLEIIRAYGDGMAPAAYQAAYHEKKGDNKYSKIDHLGRGLMKRGYLRAEGRTTNRRWFLTAKGRGGATKEPTVSVSKPTKAVVSKPLPKAVAEPVAQENALASIPGGRSATVFETKDGHIFLVMDGKTYFVPNMSELVV
jgi:hypothetical protein